MVIIRKEEKFLKHFPPEIPSAISLSWKINFTKQTTLKISINTLSTIPCQYVQVSTFQLAGINLHFLVSRAPKLLFSQEWRPGSAKKKARCRILRRIFGPHKLLQFFEGKRANTRVCMRICCVCMLEQSPVFLLSRKQTCERSSAITGWDRGETFSKRWWNTFRVTVKRKEEKRESNWPNRVLKRVLRNPSFFVCFPEIEVVERQLMKIRKWGCKDISFFKEIFVQNIYRLN